MILCYLDQHFKCEDACENVVKITQHLRSNTAAQDTIIRLERKRERRRRSNEDKTAETKQERLTKGKKFTYN